MKGVIFDPLKQEELEQIRAERNSRLAAATAAKETVEIIPVKKVGEPPECENCHAAMVFVSGHLSDDQSSAHNLYHCACGTVCREDVHPVKRSVWLYPNSTQTVVSV